jgi:ribose 5-phosphate isomerase B
MNTTFDKNLPLAIGCDHAGFEYKEAIVKMLTTAGWQVSDKGTYSTDSTDYPDYAHPVANKHQGIRAALCWTEELASLARQHNNANVLCLPSRFVSYELAEKMVNVFLATAFEGGRHEKRVNKI